MRVVGISTAHDSSVAVYTDGEIEFFYKEERITRVKRDKRPFAAMLEAVKFLDDKKIDAIAISSPHDNYIDGQTPTIVNVAQKMFKTNNTYQFLNLHHLCHASLAFYDSGFEEAVVVVVDRNGSNHPHSQGLLLETETIFTAKYPNIFEQITKNYTVSSRGDKPDSFLSELMFNEKKNNPNCEINYNTLYGITKVYETATVLIGENILENGKTMGLAAYGNKKKPFVNLFLENNTPNDSLFTYVVNPRDGWRSSLYRDHYDKLVKFVDKNDYQFYADYAYQVQKQTQEQVAKLIDSAIQKTGIKNVCVTGGYGLNVVANGYYISRFPDVNFFFEPLADDTGNSIGSAMLVYRELSKDDSIRPIKSTFVNGYEPNIDIEKINLDLKNKIQVSETNAKSVAKMLSNNKKIAIFNGKAESGPRALGNRSILFYPNLVESKDIVNRIKKREWYRPFAACVLKEDAKKYFDMMTIKESPYMTISFNCFKKTKKLFPGIVHVDGSCRVQTVDKDNKHLYNILTEIKKITGHGLLLNTSFNLAGQPLVDTLEQAVEVLLDSELEYIWIPENNSIIQKI